MSKNILRQGNGDKQYTSTTLQQIKLVIIDSIAFPFRQDFDSFATRTRILSGLAQTLIEIATSHQLAVVLTNHMTTRLNRDPATNTISSTLQPALGESWGHASTIRVLLLWEDSTRTANLYKSPSKQQSIVAFQVTADGVRDITEDDDAHPAKRRRTIESI
eukprot:m.129494 g.129494  ORF g.129494 m.129494 type:complete len:161 (+) comp37981_c0_seq3:662-1144(+)